jgi:malonate-semialdehyde dehydrogenase (acetylating)/methylmalonate-semialdehyde dehydrogenase
MVPMWMFPPALASGNAFLLKPSERVDDAPQGRCVLEGLNKA